ncbi:MFS transporter [Paenibacillus sp. YPG26]|uniref:MFS transporter n=1 Tax=Paenibacillus sp. YPG26 TaxID=2878915 RepID=UPI00203DD711|nr:MFS transporter [Paenibacillus sp. YPG26]USB32697.1 MFS transporter [Paenibacillus sp. YPG26]
MSTASKVIHSQPSTGMASRALITFTFLLGIFMGALDHGIIGPALSSIMSAFEVDASWGVWSFSLYTLVFAISIPVIGKLSDRLGRKRVFSIGIILFGAGSICAAFSPNFIVFLIGRAIQAVGTGGIFPITAAQIASSYPPEQRGRALGWIGVAFGLGSILGPAVGGVIVANTSWPWIFLINVPVCLLILVMIRTYKPTQNPVVKPIDFGGIALLVLVILAIMLGITLQNYWIAAIGIILIPLLVFVEKRQPDPVMQVRYFTGSTTLTLLVMSGLSGFVMATAANFIPLYAEMNLGLARGDSAFTVTPLAITSMLASLFGGMLTDRIGAKKTLLYGFILTLTGALLLAVSPHTLVFLLLTVLLMGFGIGIIIGSPLNVLMLKVVDQTETGMAIGYISLFRSLGSTLGPSLAGVLIAAYAADGFVPLFIISGSLSLVGIVLIGLVRPRTSNTAG